MSILSIIGSFLTDYTLRTVALGSGILGIVSGVLGAFALLRRQSLLGDAISHAALPGIVLAFMLTLSKSTLVLVLGAGAAGWLAALAIIFIVRNSRLKEDAALGLTLSVFFGFGLVLLTHVQKQPIASQAGLDKFLFGQAAALLEQDVLNMGVLSLIILLLVALFWKEFKILSFDPDFMASLGFPVRVLDVLLTTLLVFSIVVGLQTVGVVLMSAMVVAPAAAARQWTDRLSVMVVLSGLFGALAGMCGAIISSLVTQMPTGPTIVISISVIVVFSLVFAGNRGVFWKQVRQQRNRKRLQLEAVLNDLFLLAEQHQRFDHPHSIEVLRSMSIGHGGVDRSLQVLKSRGWVAQTSDGKWHLTREGMKAARALFTQTETV